MSEKKTGGNNGQDLGPVLNLFTTQRLKTTNTQLTLVVRLVESEGLTGPYCLS